MLQTLVVLSKDKQQVFRFKTLVELSALHLRFRVRGATSIYGSSKPLWVVDGVIMEDVSNVGADDLASGNPETLIQFSYLQVLTLMILRASKSLKTVLLHLYMVLVPWQVLSL